MSHPRIRLGACGDIMLHGRYDAIASQAGATTVFDAFARLTAESDLVVANLETVLASGGTPQADKLCLRGDPAYAAALRRAGIGVVSLANNHCLDFGAEGLAETRRHLTAAGVQYIGAGPDRDEAWRPLTLTYHGVHLGLIAACHASTKPSPAATATTAGIAELTPNALFDAVDALRPAVDQVVLLLHWGLEYAHYPTPQQVELAHAAVDRGVGLILGHHSHALQGIERYKGAVIAYSLANLTDASVDWRGPTRHYQADLTEVDRESILLRVSIGRDGVEPISTEPLWLDDDGHPLPAPTDRARQIAAKLSEYSSRLEAGELDAYWGKEVVDRRVTAPFISWWRSGSIWDKIRGFRPGQIVTLYLLIQTYLRIKLSRSESKWLLFSSRNDTRPMPAAKAQTDDDQ